MTTTSNRSSGFALLITLLLLALLTLAVFALSTLVKVNADVSSGSMRQMAARQNALLGLRMGLNELQQNAGSDGLVTAMAGVTGISAGANASTRHWCGVWHPAGGFVGWLTSGAQTTSTAVLQTGIDPVELVSNGSVGAATANSEHVVAGKLPISVSFAPGLTRTPVTVGKYAFWIGDEGVKISAFAPGAPVATSLASSPTTSGPAKLGAALSAYASRLPGVISFEQLSLLSTPTGPLTPSVLNDSFHHTTLTNHTLNASGFYDAGVININTTSSYVWRVILESYNADPRAPTRFSSAKLTSAAAALANGIAASSSGKSSAGPYKSVTAFLSSTLLRAAITGNGGVTVAEFEAIMAPLFSTRSDTFRLRAYGEVNSPLRPTASEGAAYCEAIVQRTTEAMPSNGGQRFQIVYFRWLLPSDI